MVASTDFPIPLIATGRMNARSLDTCDMVAKSGGNLDRLQLHATLQTPRITRGKQICLYEPAPPQNQTGCSVLHNQNNSATATEQCFDMQALCTHHVARAWVKDPGAEAGEPGCVAHGGTHVGQVDRVDREEELDFSVDSS